MVNECTLFFFVKKEKRASLVFSPSRFSLYTFDQFKKHLLTQHKIQGIQLPNVISDVQQTEEKPQTKKTHQPMFNQCNHLRRATWEVSLAGGV